MSASTTATCASYGLVEERYAEPIALGWKGDGGETGHGTGGDAGDETRGAVTSGASEGDDGNIGDAAGGE